MFIAIIIIFSLDILFIRLIPSLLNPLQRSGMHQSFMFLPKIAFDNGYDNAMLLSQGATKLSNELAFKKARFLTIVDALISLTGLLCVFILKYQWFYPAPDTEKYVNVLNIEWTFGIILLGWKVFLLLFCCLSYSKPYLNFKHIKKNTGTAFSESFFIIGCILLSIYGVI